MADTSQVNVQPWLAGLDDEDDCVDWNIPVPSDLDISSASHDANSIRYTSIARPRRNISSTRGSIHASTTHKRRSPRANLNESIANSQRRVHALTKSTQSRSFSGISGSESAGSVVQYDTVQKRSKSSSPSKKQATLEWKRRLLGGQVGYGDQTDLFGATGLENIFAQNKPAETSPKQTRSSMNWFDRSSAGAMPSSPPPWPARQTVSMPSSDNDQFEDEQLGTVQEESEIRTVEERCTEDESFESNRYGAVDSEEPKVPGTEQDRQTEQQHSSHHRTAIEPEHEKVVRNRTVSGQTDLDDFSPVFISKHTMYNGQVEYKALDSHLVKRFQKSAMDLRHPSQEASEATAHDVQHRDEVEQSVFTDGPESQPMLAVPTAQDLSLSENLPTGTPPSATFGGNVQLKRGGYSAQGSFKDRPLSPSPSKTEPSAAQDQASSLLSPIDTNAPNIRPTTPRQDESEPRSRSSASPLKLFGPHDTFTSNRLLRRMSQLDPDLSQLRSRDTSDQAEVQRPGQPRKASFRNVSGSSFGNGELSHHAFNAEITITSASNSSTVDSDRSPGSEVPPPGSKTPLNFRPDHVPLAHDASKLKRKMSVRSAVNSNFSTLETRYRQPTVEDAAEATFAKRPSNFIAWAGKRPPNSPFKAPTPKRRRTLHTSEVEQEVSEANRSYHNHLQEVLTANKRNEQTHDIADPDVLAQRPVLRPRNPTPSQRRRDKIEAEIREAAEQFAKQEPEALEAVMEQIESSMASESPPSVQQQAKTVANEVAKFSLRVQKASGEHTERKRSVTTQDFFNEAVLVMRLIREKAGRQSGLGSVQESDQEAMSEGQDQSGQDLSSLRVSRPPSRDGGSGWRPRTSEQTDARVISHLRRYQERDDTEFLAPSVASVHVDAEEQEVVVDEHSNIRIRGPMPPHDSYEDDPSRPSTQHSQQSSLASHSTQHSDATSTGRTLISRKSDNVGTLAPDAVAHLIGDQVGAMTYDKDKQQWVKARSPKKQTYGSFLEPPSNITSEDDPFREISDLPVDEHKEEEIRRASATRSRRPSVQPEVDFTEQSAYQQIHVEHAVESRTTSQETVVNRPTTRDSKISRHTYSSSDPTRYTAFTSSQAQQTNETRATSWGDEDLQRLAAQGKAQQQPLAYAAAHAALALAQRHEGHGVLQQVDEEDSIYRSPPRQKTWDDVPAEGSIVDDSAVIDDSADAYSTNVDDLDADEVASSNPPREPFSKKPPSSIYRGAARQMSLRRRTLTSKFNDAEAHEQSELSFVAPLPGDRMMSVSLSVSRPLSKRQTRVQALELPSSPAKYDPSFVLSDLADFTMQGEEKERPSERDLARRLAQHAKAEVDDQYALAVKDIVKILTDVKEDEPYWEQVKQLDLHDRSLASLHGLEEFCGRTQDLDVSGNRLLYVHGAPTAVRNLVARSNQLSSLTSWDHLLNLQYLDISGNQLNNLDGLSCLIHLRELRAADNEIASLHGVTQLDGLLKLKLRRNKLRNVDFAENQLYRLEELDLCNNSITALQNLEYLPALETLKLGGNKAIGQFELKHEMPHLKHLSLNDCGLRRLNVRLMPNLRTLTVDGNCLPTIDGIETLKHLELLSMRRQTLSQGKKVTILEKCIHARTVRLSGNELPSITIPESLLSVQQLELASSGLQELPSDFGLMLPNLTTLNLNFNSLKDIRPLLNIQKLEKLHVCGNRLDRLRKTAATLSKLKSLTSVDVRGNNLTQAFYPLHTCTPAPLTSIVRRPSTPSHEEGEDVAAEEGEVAKYILPPADAEQDRIHHKRMDDDTKLRRKVYHLLLGSACHALEYVDGLTFDKTGAMARDKIWYRLLELGVLKKSGDIGLREQQALSP